MAGLSADEEKKHPRRTNLGGLWMLNPHAPRCLATNLYGPGGINAGSLNVGNSMVIPPAMRFKFVGTPRTDNDNILTEEHNIGEFVATTSQARAITYIRSGGYLAYYFTEPYPKGAPAEGHPKWILFYGTYTITQGPHSVADSNGYVLTRNWYLGSRMHDGDVLHLYELRRPAASERYITEFNALGINIFRVRSTIQGTERSSAVAGDSRNIEVEVEAYWP